MFLPRNHDKFEGITTLVRFSCFVWIAVPRRDFAGRQILLQNMIGLAKYLTKMDRCVGMAYAVRTDGLIELEMGYVEDPWAHDPVAEQALAEHNPFEPFSIERKPRYRID
jgi:hypothetical protein